MQLISIKIHYHGLGQTHALFELPVSAQASMVVRNEGFAYTCGRRQQCSLGLKVRKWRCLQLLFTPIIKAQADESVLLVGYTMRTHNNGYEALA